MVVVWEQMSSIKSRGNFVMKASNQFRCVKGTLKYMKRFGGNFANCSKEIHSRSKT